MARSSRAAVNSEAVFMFVTLINYSSYDFEFPYLLSAFIGQDTVPHTYSRGRHEKFSCLPPIAPGIWPRNPNAKEKCPTEALLTRIIREKYSDDEFFGPRGT